MRLFAALALIVLFVFAIIPVEAQKSKGRKTSTAAPGLGPIGNDDSALCSHYIAGGHLEAICGRPAGAGQADSGGPDHGRHFPEPVLERQRRPAFSIAEGSHDTPGQSPAAVFHDQQRPLVNSGWLQSVSARRPGGEVEGCELLSGRHEPRRSLRLGLRLYPRKSRSRPRDFSP